VNTKKLQRQTLDIRIDQIGTCKIDTNGGQTWTIQRCTCASTRTVEYPKTVVVVSVRRSAESGKRVFPGFSGYEQIPKIDPCSHQKQPEKLPPEWNSELRVVDNERAPVNAH